VLKIDEARRNIVVSRRKLIETARPRRKAAAQELEVGQVRKGVVKNIADFGAFVDLGGIDGLLHITDMSWGRIGHPSEMVKIDQEIEVKICTSTARRKRSPWAEAEDAQPVGERRGQVPGRHQGQGRSRQRDELRRVRQARRRHRRPGPHQRNVVDQADQPSQRAGADRRRDRSVVLGINKDKQEISLGMKQTQENPWDKVAEKYPPGTIVKGTVRNLTNYGAFIEIEEGIDGLLHVSDMSWTRKISHPNEMLEKGQKSSAGALGRSGPPPHRPGPQAADDDPWATDIPNKYQPGQIVKGKVTKITNFGVFVGWKTAWKACCTSRSWPTTRSRTPKTSSRSATRSR
jgi:small subunit ribosomal protein S1